MELKGDLRSAEIWLEEGAGRKDYKVELESTGRFGEGETHEFRPDTSLRVGLTRAQALLILHYDKEQLGGEEYVDVRLVLVPIGEEDERVLQRIGYLETRYSEMRDNDAIHEDLWWKFVQLR
jgi:hypothetical protein